MRFAGFLLLVFAATGIAAAQDTNFPTGPQYLMTFDSPLFLHSIATPTMSLDAPLPSVPFPATESITVVSSSSEPASAPNPYGLARIYWGGPAESVVELSSEEPFAPLPSSIAGDGVAGMTDASSLRERGYGITLGEVAAFWKAHKAHATHVYTESDLERLRDR
jgi:hypothetical protein